MKIVVGIPSQETVMTTFAISLATLLRGSNGNLELGIINNRSCSVSGNRNTIVKVAQEIKADYILFLDSDMVFPSTILTTLLSRKKDIVAGLYRKRYPPFEMLGQFANPLTQNRDLDFR